MTEIRTGTSILGLTHDPFREPEDAFFEGGDRTRQLEELRHLSRWSRRVLVVTGEKGLGKSTLFRALSSRLDPGVKAARVRGTLINGARDMLVAILQGFGLAASANVNIQTLATLICDEVAVQHAAERYCLILVDDAHLLEPRAVEQLLALVRRQPVRVVCFAEPQFVPILEKEAQHGEKPVSWHEIRLAPFGSEEIRRYLKLRLREAGGKEDLPFTPKQVGEIIHRSRGNPGQINAQASEQLLLQAQAMTQDTGAKLPVVHRSIAYLVIVLTVLLWLVWQRIQPSEVLLTPTSSSAGKLDIGAESSQLSQTEGRSSPVLVKPLAKPVSQDQEAPSTADAGVVSDTFPEPTTAQDVVTSDSSEISDTAGITVATETSDATNRETEDGPEEQTSEAPGVVAQPLPTAQPDPVVPVDVEPGSVDWILLQPPENFTLQLFGTSNQGKWREFMARQHNDANVASFRTTRNGKDWYVVLYGSYPNRRDAAQMANHLPETLGKVSPWVRTFGGIQETLRKTALVTSP